MTQSVMMMRARPPIAMPAIAPTEILEPSEPTFVAEDVGDSVEDEDDVDDVDVVTCAMRVGA